MTKRSSRPKLLSDFSEIVRISSEMRLPPLLNGDSTRPADPGRSPHPSAEFPDLDKITARAVPHMMRRSIARAPMKQIFSEPPLISVIMTCYNSAPFIERAIRSILDQTWRRLQLVVVDDCGTDGTRAIVEKMAADDSRLKLLCFGVNRGTYWCKNYGITRSSGEVVTFMDSDDYSAPDRLESQFALLNQCGKVMTMCNCIRYDERGETVLNRGAVERQAPISMMIKRAVFNEIGYFDSVRTSADDEMLQRIRLVYGTDAVANTKKPSLSVLHRAGSLTTDIENQVLLCAENESTAQFLSKPRQLYAEGYRKWHRLVVEKKALPYMPFPVVHRPFDVYGKVAVDGTRFAMQRIWACMSLCAGKNRELDRTVTSLIDQIDRLYVALPESEKVPPALNRPNVTISRIPTGEIPPHGALSAFGEGVPKGYCLMVEPGIIYPDNYVQCILRKIEIYERKAVVGVGGVILTAMSASAPTAPTLLKCEEAAPRDRAVDLLDIGTIGFHTSLIHPERSLFKSAGLEALWFAIHCHNAGIPLVAIERSRGWVKRNGEQCGSISAPKQGEKAGAMEELLLKAFEARFTNVRFHFPSNLAAKIKALGAAFAGEVLEAPNAHDAGNPSPGQSKKRASELYRSLEDASIMHRPQRKLHAQSIVYDKKPLITVIMTTFNTVRYVEAAIRSILEQSWKKLELIIVDDCSTDGTRSLIEKLARSDSRLSLYCFGANRGTYWSKNFGITRASGSVITFMDSDDTCDPSRIARQFKALNQPGVVVSTCNYHRVNSKGIPLAGHEKLRRMCFLSMMLKREVFDEVGYFDSVRTSADSELHERLKAVYGAAAHVNIPRVLYWSIHRENSLTTDPENSLVVDASSGTSKAFLSEPRKLYAACHRRWHAELAEKKLQPYVPFPVVSRPFRVTGRIAVDNVRYDRQVISACVASFPPRRALLEKTVGLILGQVDRLYVYLNQYDTVPTFLNHPKVTVELGKGRDLRDNGKFYFGDRIPSGYCLTIDDDLNYPRDYVQHLIRKIEFYDRAAVIGLHGVLFKQPFERFCRGRLVSHFRDSLARDRIVNLLGTGTVAFHTDLLRPRLEDFLSTGMADIWFSILCKRLGVSLVCMERPSRFLRPLTHDTDDSLFAETRSDDLLQTLLVKGAAPWSDEPSERLAALVRSRIEQYGASFARCAFDMNDPAGRLAPPSDGRWMAEWQAEIAEEAAATPIPAQTGV